METNQYKEIMNAIAELHTGQELIKQEITGVKDHLGTLNSKVATQAGQIGQVQLRNATEDGKKAGSKNIVTAMWSVGSVIICSVGVVILEHFFK